MKNGIGFGLFVLGAGIGALGSARFFKTKYEKVCEEEIQKVRSFYDKRAKELEESIVNLEKKNPDDIPTPPTEKSSIGATGPSDPRSYEDLTDYARYASVYKRESVEEAVRRAAESESPTEDAPVKKKQRPVLITRERYGEDEEFEPKLVYYYTMGETLTIVDEETDDEEQIEEKDISEMFGDCLTKYSFTTSDEDVIYIRSPLRKEDYKVLKVRGYYS